MDNLQFILMRINIKSPDPRGAQWHFSILSMENLQILQAKKKKKPLYNKT